MPGKRRSVGWVICAHVGPAAVRCRVTHVLLAVSCLLRRADAVEVIGAALRAKAAGAGHRPIAARLGRPASTVRGWLRAFARNAETVRSVFTALLVQLDPLHRPAASRPGRCSLMRSRRSARVLPRPGAGSGVVGAVSPWQLASAVTDGRLLAPALAAVLINTNWPLGTPVDQRRLATRVQLSRGVKEE